MTVKKTILAVITLIALHTSLTANIRWDNLHGAYNQPAAINLNPQTLDELRKVVLTNGRYPQNAQQAFALTLEGMAQQDREVRTLAANLFLRLFKKLPQAQYKNCKKFFRGMGTALSLDSEEYFLNDRVQRAFTCALVNNDLTTHKMLLETCLDVVEAPRNEIEKSANLLQVLASCIESSGMYANGTAGERKFHARVIARVVKMLQLFFDHYADAWAVHGQHGLLGRATDGIIVLLDQATHLSKSTQQGLIFQLGKAIYDKQRTPGYCVPHDAQDQASHSAQMTKLHDALAKLEQKLD